jgi:hypothetical protein
VGFVFKLRGVGVVPVLTLQFLLFLKRFGVVCRYVLAVGCQVFFAGVL